MAQAVTEKHPRVLSGQAFKLPEGDIAFYLQEEIEQRLKDGYILLKVENETPGINNEIEQEILAQLPPNKASAQEVRDAVQAIALLWETNPSVARRIEKGLIALAKL